MNAIETAVVTGAASGIGRELVGNLAAQGVALHLPGRNRAALAELATLLTREHPQLKAPEVYDLDLADSVDAWQVPTLDAIDLLVHCAGDYSAESIIDTSQKDLERLFRVNVSAPLELTRRLLPALLARHGQIVFINSSVTQQTSRAAPGAYAATKKAAASVADSVRDAVNDSGVRVLSVYPGRTATPMQERIFESEQRAYTPETLLQSGDVCAAVLAALSLPRTAELTDLMIRPFAKH